MTSTINASLNSNTIEGHPYIVFIKEDDAWKISNQRNTILCLLRLGTSHKSPRRATIGSMPQPFILHDGGWLSCANIPADFRINETQRMMTAISGGARKIA